MKKVMMTILVVMVVVVLTSSPAKAQPTCRRNYGYGYGYRSVLGRSYGYYGHDDRTLGRVMGYGGLALDVLHGLNQISVNNRMVRMAEREQVFRHQQYQRDQQIGVQISTVRRRPIVLQVRRPKAQKNKNQKLQQEIEALKIQLKELQQQVKK